MLGEEAGRDNQALGREFVATRFSLAQSDGENEKRKEREWGGNEPAEETRSWHDERE